MRKRMKIYFDGDSFTKGTELVNKERDRFSRLICNSLGAEEYNIAKGGSSNLAITRRLIVENDISQYDYAIINMTMAMRFEFYDGEKYVSIRPPSKIRGKHGSHLLKKLETFDVIEWMRKFYSDIYHDKLGNDYECMLYNCIRNHCKVHNVPLILTTNRTFGRKYRNLESLVDFHLNLDKYPKMGEGHPSKKGHEMIASDILDIINSENLF